MWIPFVLLNVLIIMLGVLWWLFDRSGKWIH